MNHLNWLKLLLLPLAIFLPVLCCQKPSLAPAHTVLLSSIPVPQGADAKFLKFKSDGPDTVTPVIATSIDGTLTLLNGRTGQVIKHFPELHANWLCTFENKYIIYANAQKQVELLCLSETYEIKSRILLFTFSNLVIDPAITRCQNRYFLTLTEIEGTVNNGNPSVKNGKYTLHLYESENLTDWKFVTDIISKNQNIEDVDLFSIGQKLCTAYELETVDHGLSSICLQMTESLGVHAKTFSPAAVRFGQPVTLLPADCDHEPAVCMTSSSKQVLKLYYSCDREAVGKSYAAGQIYLAEFDTATLSNACKPVRNRKMPTETKDSILLYDVYAGSDGIYYLFARDYMTNCSLCVEHSPVHPF